MAITDDRRAYIETPDVIHQMWFLGLHVVVVRMMASLWSRGLAQSLEALHLDEPSVTKIKSGALGRWANVGAVLAGAFFIVRDTYMAFHDGPSGMNAFDDPEMRGFAALGMAPVPLASVAPR